MSGQRDVAKALVKLHIKDEQQIKNISAAEQLLKDLHFDKFAENVSCKVARGIELKNFPIFVENFARRFAVPTDIKSSLLEGQYADDMTEIVLNFDFRKGERGSHVYGRVAMMKRGDKIDLAYSVYTLEFKISPVLRKCVREDRFLLFYTKQKVWYVNEQVEFTTKEEDCLKNFFMMKAINGFRSTCAAEIEGCHEMDYIHTLNCV